MKITKENILSLGFVIQEENPVGFSFYYPKTILRYVFWNKSETITLDILGNLLQEDCVEFHTLEHFILSHQTLTLSKLKGVKVMTVGDYISVKYIPNVAPLCDPNTQFCLNQNKEASA